ncbi:hypothetical protein K440DRAFT_73172 [Wilcoxina mikolae CBS 423.85]|nr:hypothetical protein K440DRAFT_73172 [Wilcoxina mikolae CBS 423.85]
MPYDSRVFTIALFRPISGSIQMRRIHHSLWLIYLFAQAHGKKKVPEERRWPVSIYRERKINKACAIANIKAGRARQRQRQHVLKTFGQNRTQGTFEQRKKTGEPKEKALCTCGVHTYYLHNLIYRWGRRTMPIMSFREFGLQTSETRCLPVVGCS